MIAAAILGCEPSSARPRRTRSRRGGSCGGAACSRRASPARRSGRSCSSPATLTAPGRCGRTVAGSRRTACLHHLPPARTAWTAASCRAARPRRPTGGSGASMKSSAWSSDDARTSRVARSVPARSQAIERGLAAGRRRTTTSRHPCRDARMHVIHLVTVGHGCPMHVAHLVTVGHGCPMHVAHLVTVGHGCPRSRHSSHRRHWSGRYER
jgi:hypothetical protein